MQKKKYYLDMTKRLLLSSPLDSSLLVEDKPKALFVCLGVRTSDRVSVTLMIVLVNEVIF